MKRLDKVDRQAAPEQPGAFVTYQSRGAVLVVGDDARVLPPALKLAEHRKVLAFAPGLALEGQPPRNLSVVGGRVVALQGYLGRFRAQAAFAGGGRRDIAAFCPNPDGLFDLVLDLSAAPLVAQALPPPGYFAPRGDADIETALTALAGMVGTYRGSRFVALDPHLCTHGAGGLQGCQRCMAACDAAAIRSAGPTVAIDPYLCQDCAGCAVVCPTGAISFTTQPVAGQLARLAQPGPKSAHDAAGTAGQRVLVVHVASVRPREASLQGAQTMAVSALPAMGEEVWLAALASGWRAVVLVDDDTMPPRARVALEGRVLGVKSILAACGLDPRAVTLCAAEQLRASLEALPVDLVTPRATSRASSVAAAGKRAVTVWALSALGADRAGPVVDLEPGAPFGDVQVDAAACTLCMACTHLCPTNALIGDERPHPRLRFVAAACVQCGLCAAGCPERAVSLRPRVDIGAMVRPAARPLAQDSWVTCADCGRPFMGLRQWQRSAQIVAAVADPGGSIVKMLSRCTDCRIRLTPERT